MALKPLHFEGHKVNPITFLLQGTKVVGSVTPSTAGVLKMWVVTLLGVK